MSIRTMAMAGVFGAAIAMTAAPVAAEAATNVSCKVGTFDQGNRHIEFVGTYCSDAPVAGAPYTYAVSELTLVKSGETKWHVKLTCTHSIRFNPSPASAGQGWHGIGCTLA